MKLLIALILSSTFAFANYSIYYGNLKLGKIENFDTLKDNYLHVKITNSVARFLMGKKYLILYNDAYTRSKNDKKTKYKRDKYQVINIIKKSINNELTENTIYFKKDKYIQITHKENYNFKYISKGKVKSNGTIEVKDQEFIALIDTKNSVKIIKN